MIHIYCIGNMHYLLYVGCPRWRVDSRVARVGAATPLTCTTGEGNTHGPHHLPLGVMEIATRGVGGHKP